MKRLFLFCVLLCVVGCGKDTSVPATPDNTPVITPERDVMDVAKEGGSYSVRYTVTNPMQGAPLAADSEASWITDIDVATEGVVCFNVACNDTPDVREAVITLRYPSAAEFPEIVVRQAATTTATLVINLTNVNYSECTAEITPESEDMSYVVMMAEKSYFTDGYISDSESLIAADENYFRTLMYEGVTLEEFLAQSNIARQGVTTKRWEDLSPAKEYVIYTYGIDVEGDNYRRTTPVYHHVITSRLPERHAVEFAMTVTAEGPEVCADVVPEGWDGYYMVQFVEDTEAGFIPEGEPFDEEHEVALAESFFYVADHLYYFEGLTADEVMQQLGYRGAATIEKTLNANHKYMAMTYAIASDDGNVPMVVSHPVIEYFTTGSVEASTMTFEVDIYNIRPRSVDIRITPSTDEQYTAVVMYASNLPEGSPEEQLDYICSKYAPLELSGIYEEHIDQLPPDTEFVLAIYGYYAGVPTTQLNVHRFATAKDGAGGNTITEVRCTAYDLNEVVALEPYYSSYVGYADYFMSVEVVTAQPSLTLHFDIFPTSVYEEYGDDAIRESLLEYSYTSSPDWALCNYGNEYVVCGLAEDENGFVGDMFVSEPITFSYEDCDDAAIFVELYKEYTMP